MGNMAGFGVKRWMKISFDSGLYDSDARDNYCWEVVNGFGWCKDVYVVEC